VRRHRDQYADADIGFGDAVLASTERLREPNGKRSIGAMSRFFGPSWLGVLPPWWRLDSDNWIWGSMGAAAVE
jgi:hypothetical protein